MHLVSLVISDFRNIVEATIEPDPEGTTVITGLNGAGKTSVLEAIGYLSTLQSFRGTPREAMVGRGADHAILRAETLVGGRSVTIEAELSTTGRSRTMLNRQSVRRRAELHEAIRTTVFSPEDIGVVRAGPTERRRFLDETLAVVDPKAAHATDEVDKILRQRSALLRSTGRRLTPEVAATLDVWDTRLDTSGTALVEAREALVQELVPIAAAHYARLAGQDTPVGLDYRRSWSGRLIDALAGSRRTDVDRGVSSIGPHRDDLDLSLDGLPGRTHSSQGEQRSLALALRLAAHQLATERLGSPPVLLLDDVFSELDPFRAKALLAGLPPGQALLTTALPAPPEVSAAKIYQLEAGGHVATTGTRGPA
ncbi:MAG: DNA replication and repair protein RecF [Acidimicrobiales bacterium]|nr:DNA replication and repair protein RecF [Acidimicrobiales bacterium]